MTQNTPQTKKIDKQKRTEKKVKKKALQDFLQKSQISPSSDLVSTNLSDQQQKVDAADKSNCYLCMVDLGEKKRTCGFCNMPACSEHMRKKRKNKEANKFLRICDDCEDRYLYSKYMKLQIKNQQSIAIQQSIIQAQRDELEQQVKKKRDRFQIHKKKQQQILNLKKQREEKLKQQENLLKQTGQKIQKSQKEYEESKKSLKQFEQRLPPSLEQDYHSLEIQLEKVKKQMLKYEKLCSQAATAKNKKEKEIYNQYYKWEETQRQRLNNKKEEECLIF